MPLRDRTIIGYPLRVLAALGGRHWLRHTEPLRPSPYLAPILRGDATLPARLAAVRDEHRERRRATRAGRSAAAVIADELIRNAAAEALRRRHAGYER